MGRKERIRTVVLVLFVALLGIFVLVIPRNTRNLTSSTIPPITNPDGSIHKPWCPSPETDITGYLVSYGTQSGKHDTTVDVGLGNKADLPGLICGTTYYLVVTAYNACGMHSEPSAEITYTPKCDDDGSGDDDGDIPPITPPLPGYHLACNTSKQCVSVPGSGVNLCDSHSFCSGGGYMRCDENMACVPAAGIGFSSCGDNADCYSEDEDPWVPEYPLDPSLICPAGEELRSVEEKIYTVEISYDGKTWEIYKADVGPSFDEAKELRLLAFPPDGDPAVLPNYPPEKPKAFLRIRIETKIVLKCVPKGSVMQSSVFGGSSSTIRTTGDVMEESSSLSILSRISRFFSSLFSFLPGMRSDVLNIMAPSESEVMWLLGDQNTKNVQILTQGNSEGDTLTLVGPQGVTRIDTLEPFKYSLPEGSKLSITATPGPNSKFVQWKGGCQTIEGNTCSFTVTRAKGVTAVFEPIQKYILTATNTGTGKGTISGLTDAILGYSTTSHFTAIASVNIGNSVTLNAIPSPGSVFTGWSGACTGKATCTILMNSDKNVEALFTKIMYTVTTVKSGTGTGTISGISSNPQNFPLGTNVVLTATPSGGSTFVGWSGGCSGTKQCILYMNENKIITATFVPTTYTLSATKDGTGSGTITGMTGTSQAFPPGRTVTLTADARSGSSFVRWTGCTTTSGKTCTVTMSSAKTVKATFNLVTHYTLSIAKSGTGSGLIRWKTSEGVTGSTRNSIQLSLPRDITIELSAQPDAGSDTPTFVDACRGTGTCSIKMGSNKTLQVIIKKY